MVSVDPMRTVCTYPVNKDNSATVASVHIPLCLEKKGNATQATIIGIIAWCKKIAARRTPIVRMIPTFFM